MLTELLIATLRKENAALHSEQHKIEPLEHELEELKSNLASLKEEKPVLQCKVFLGNFPKHNIIWIFIVDLFKTLNFLFQHHQKEKLVYNS